MLLSTSLRPLAVLFVALGTLGGCSKDDAPAAADHDHDDVPAECAAIIEACHERDLGVPGKAHTCHENAHDGTAEKCAAVQTECIAACNALGTDAGTDAG